MAASTSDKITDTRNGARPISTTVTSPRSIGGTTLTCQALTGWPTASKVHFVTYQKNTNDEPIAGTQLDCYGIVSGNTITSFTVVDGTDAGNAIGDVVEMLPTAAWGQGLADALTAEHNRNGTHATVTATSVTASGNVQAGSALIADTISEKTSNTGVTVDGLLIKDGYTRAFDKSALSTDSNPYKFSVYRNGAWTASSSPQKIQFDTELYDTNNNYDNVTNYRYTAPVSGYYHFDACVSTAQTSGIGYGPVLYVNGSNSTGKLGNRVMSGFTSTGFYIGTTVSADLKLTAGDYVEVYYICGTGDTGDTGQNTVYFNGHLISRT